MTLFSIKNLIVRKGQKTLIAIDQLDLAQHKLTAIIGANGAGKSTLLNAILTSNESMTCLGVPVKEVLKAGRIAWVGQHEVFALPLTVLEYALLGLTPSLGFYKTASSADKTKAMMHLDFFGLVHLVDKRLQTLSGGERQRLAIVRALMQESEVLLLDEPSNHLDIKHQRTLFAKLRTLVENEHKSIVVVLHDLTDAYRYADDVVALKAGQVVAVGNKEEVMTDEVLYTLYETKIFRHDTAHGVVFS